MKLNPLRIFCALMIFSSPALAQEDECMLKLETLMPVMQDIGKEHSFNLNKDDRSLTKTATLDDGLNITYNVGGCVHYAFSYHFENIPGGVPAEPEDPFAFALALLNRVPLKNPEDQGVTVMRRALEEQSQSGYAAFENDSTEWACGDATCGLKLDPDNSVTLLYDFAL